MRRLIWIAAAGFALLGAGIAVAHEGQGKSVKQVSATFTATTGGDVRTDTCTGRNVTLHDHTGPLDRDGDGQDRRSPATPRSMRRSSSTPPATARSRAGSASTAPTTRRQIRRRRTRMARTSRARRGPRLGELEQAGREPLGRLVVDGGFTNGKLGGGTAGGNAVVVTSGGCRPGAGGEAGDDRGARRVHAVGVDDDHGRAASPARCRRPLASGRVAATSATASRSSARAPRARTRSCRPSGHDDCTTASTTRPREARNGKRRGATAPSLVFTKDPQLFASRVLTEAGYVDRNSTRGVSYDGSLSDRLARPRRRLRAASSGRCPPARTRAQAARRR